MSDIRAESSQTYSTRWAMADLVATAGSVLMGASVIAEWRAVRKMGLAQPSKILIYFRQARAVALRGSLAPAITLIGMIGLFVAPTAIDAVMGRSGGDNGPQPLTPIFWGALMIAGGLMRIISTAPYWTGFWTGSPGIIEIFGGLGGGLAGIAGLNVIVDQARSLLE